MRAACSVAAPHNKLPVMRRFDFQSCNAFGIHLGTSDTLAVAQQLNRNFTAQRRPVYLQELDTVCHGSPFSLKPKLLVDRSEMVPHY
jgi:hypothetical protein